MLIELEKEVHGGMSTVGINEYYSWDPVEKVGDWSITSWDLAPEASRGLGGLSD
jgi:hypothetical protein